MDSLNDTKISTKYKYNTNINRIYEILTDKHNYCHIIGEECENFRLEKGNSLSEEGAIYSYRWCKAYEIQMEIKKIIQNENYKQITISSIKMIPLNMKFHVTYKLYWDSIDNCTILIKELLLNNKEINNEIIEPLKFREKKSLMVIDILLQKLKFDQEETIYLEKNIIEIWNILSDWRILCSKIPIFAKFVEYIGNHTELNTIVKILNEEEYEYQMKVSNYIYTDNEAEIVLVSVNEKDIDLKQEIFMKVVNLNNKNCFVSYKHTFYNFVDDIYIQLLSEKKKKILQSLKNI